MDLETGSRAVQQDPVVHLQGKCGFLMGREVGFLLPHAQKAQET